MILGSMMRRAVLAAVLTLASVANAAPILQYNFNSETPDSNTTTGSLTPNLNLTSGAPTVSVVGGATNPGFFSGGTSGTLPTGSTDPAASSVDNDNSAYQVTTFPAQGTASGTAGFQVAGINTTGFQDITVTFDQRYSGSASRWGQFQYTLDGANFITTGLSNDGIYETSATVADQWSQFTFDLTGIAGVNNNPNFGFRAVSIFAPSTSAYAPTNVSSTYGPTGTWRFDVVTVSANPIPEPGTYALVAMSLTALALAGRRRRLV